MGIKVHFEDPDYVIVSFCLQTFDTDKRMVAAVAGEPRWASGGRSIVLSAMMQSQSWMGHLEEYGTCALV